MADTGSSLRLALAQLNPTVGDLAGNERKVRGALDEARRAGAQLVVFPEMVVTGYPPEDLLLKEHFLRDARATLDRIAADVDDMVAIVGFPERTEDVYNAVAVVARRRVQATYHKVFLPNYGVFDEQRYFQSGDRGGVVELGHLRLGITICEDIWEPGPPLSDEALAGATVIVNASASPYHAGKGLERERMITQRARDSLAAVAFCNLVGGQDELVFDGHSVVIDHDGTVVARARQFAEELLVAEVDPGGPATARLRDARHRPAARRIEPRVDVLASLPLPSARGRAREPSIAPPLQPEAEVYQALTTGLRDYVDKNGFDHAVLGLSGGIDSALVACVAADALGPERVTAAVMPSPYSSAETQADARTVAANLGLECLELDIAPAMDAYERLLEPAFDGRDPDITEENLQARIRGNLLMALSNKFGWLVLTTGNKSELSVGYSTLYGDTAGGFAVIKDCPKTLVYALARHRNAVGGERPPIPESILERAPSAELRPDQRDEDSLPAYPDLDPILAAYVEADADREQLIGRGASADAVDRTIALVDLAEYKRRQAPPGIKITSRAFGRDRRMPITNRYRG
ncbi:MAG TPA: NAD+ synthase [Solirubrobacteraceae bacterium]|nr:NAD+ synthase [Solirubrobacteraceae bacterium]